MITNNTYFNNTKPPKYCINGHTVRSMYYNGELIFHHVPCVDIKLNVHELVLTSKGKYNLKVTLVPADCNEEIIVRSTDNNIATINNDNIIIPNNIGTCNIEVKCGKVTAICKVHVKSENIILYNQGAINNDSEFGQFNYPSHSNFALQTTQMFIQIPGSGSSYGAAWFSWANSVEISEYDELQIYTTNPNDHSSVIGITRNTVANQAGYKVGIPTPIDTNDFISDRTIVTLAQSSGSKQHKLDMDLIGGENGYLGLYFKRLESGDSVSEHILIDKILVVRKNVYVIGSGEDLSEDVNVPCTGVDFPQDELVLNYEGQTITYDLNSILDITPSNTDEQKIWAMIESDNTVSVSSNGILTVTGKGHGHVQVIVGNYFDNIRIKVTSNCTGISLDKSNVSLSDIDSSDTIIATLLPSYTTDEVKWTVSNSNVVTINGNGTTCVVTAKANGNCMITATCGSKSATCNITVSVACRDITFDIDSLTIGLDTGTYNVAQYVNVIPISCQLPVTWNIDKTSIATIDANGVVTPKSVGSCTITATCGGKSVTLPLNVESTSATLELTSYESYMAPGETHTFYADLYNGDINKLIVNSSNSAHVSFTYNILSESRMAVTVTMSEDAAAGAINFNYESTLLARFEAYVRVD